MRSRMFARAADDIDYIALHPGLDPHMLYFKTTPRDCIRFAQRLYVDLIQTARVESCIPTCDDLLFFVRRRIGKHNLQQETIELRLRQRISAFVLDRIFGCQHGKHRRERITFTVNRDLPLFHCFEQRRLRLRRRAINLVSKQDIGEHRTTPQVKARVCQVEYVGARDVRRHQVWRELNPPEPRVNNARECLDGKRFGRAGNTFDQRVAFGEQRDQNLFDGSVLADDNFAQLGCYVCDCRGNVFGHFRYPILDLRFLTWSSIAQSNF